MLLKLNQWPLVHSRLRQGRAATHEAPVALPAVPVTEPAAAPKRPDLNAWQAAALCDLLADPSSGITRIHVVGARPTLVDTVDAEATRRGLVSHMARSAALGTGRATIERTGTAVER